MQLLVYVLVYPFLWFISILPFKALYALSDVVFVFIFNVFKYRKKVVKQNLTLAFPEKSKAEIATITKNFYRHLCDVILESIKSISITESEMRKRFIFTNIEELNALEAQKRNIVFLMAHYASWEWIYVMQRYISHRGFGIYKRLENKYFDRLIKRNRAKYNAELITTKETIAVLTASKAKGELSISGFASDQSPKPEKAHHWREFMGIKVPVHTGAEMIAKKLDMAVGFFAVKKVKRGFYEAHFTLLAERPNDYKDYELTDRFIELVEQQIQQAPEYYLWTHKRWKHRDKVPAKFL